MLNAEMEKKRKNPVREWLDNFNKRASVTHNGKEYGVDEHELETLYSTLNYWHHRTDPSSWLCTALVGLAKKKYQGKIPRSEIILLCARLLNVTASKLESTLDWNANYIAWHDGGNPGDYHVWEKE
ncbi:MAG: hypothetical protein JW881_08475 [Spirochaetales bacterium]|nr:hypothetical protein [Spirochaetales bacterium]